MQCIKGVAVLALGVAAACSHAVVAFDNFGANDTFSINSGLTISGSTSVAAQWRQACQFVSSATGVLDKITLPVSHNGGTNTVVVTMLNDGGNVLGSWFLSTIITGGLPQFGSSFSPTVITNPFNWLTLTAGSKYWLLVEPDENTAAWGTGKGQDSWLVWNHNTIGDVGLVGYSNDGGASYQYGDTTLGAFRVEVGEPTVPGPAAVLPFAIGFVAACRRRRK